MVAAVIRLRPLPADQDQTNVSNFSILFSNCFYLTLTFYLGDWEEAYTILIQKPSKHTNHLKVIRFQSQILLLRISKWLPIEILARAGTCGNFYISFFIFLEEFAFMVDSIWISLSQSSSLCHEGSMLRNRSLFGDKAVCVCNVLYEKQGFPLSFFWKLHSSLSVEKDHINKHGQILMRKRNESHLEAKHLIHDPF